MAEIITLAGSPTYTSRSTTVLAHLLKKLEGDGYTTQNIAVRDFDPEDLLTANFNSPTIKTAIVEVQRARGVILATPVYKAAYTGLLKAFLDLLPQDGLAGKIVLPIATGGSLAHMLSIDYALKPVLNALGARQVLAGVYLQDSQIQLSEGNLQSIEDAAAKRLDQALLSLTHAVGRPDSFYNAVHSHEGGVPLTASQLAYLP